MIICYHVNYANERVKYYAIEYAMNRFHEVNGHATLTKDTYKPDLNPCNVKYKLISSKVIFEK